MTNSLEAREATSIQTKAGPSGKINKIITRVHNLSGLVERVAYRFRAFEATIQNSSPSHIIHQAGEALAHPRSVEIHVIEVHLHYGVQVKGPGSSHTDQNLLAQTQSVPPLVDNNFEQ